MNNFNNESAFQRFLYTTDELYIYIHRSNKHTQPYSSDILLLTILSVFLVTFLKMILIFLCFFLKWLIWDIIKIIIKLLKYKCSILWKECCFNINYFKKVFKKIYTYNFYSYDIDVYGKFWIIIIPLIYISFIIGNLIFNFMEYLETKQTDLRNIFLVIIFFLHLFIEIYISLFYYIKDLKKHIFRTFYMFLIGCLIVLLLFSFTYFDPEMKNFQLVERIVRTFFLMFFLWAYVNSLKLVLFYNMNSNDYIIINFT